VQTIRKILRERNAASIYLPLSVAVLLCSAFWGAYGIVLGDITFIYPNIPGVLLAAIQIGLRCCFGARCS